MLTIDGSRGEGGGQILRTALGLSLATGTPFRIANIRAGRERPGLLRQHLTAVDAARAIGSAEVIGAELGSRELTFLPGRCEGGTYAFAVGTAGSTMLVLQTVLPALFKARKSFVLSVSGGTHNPHSPPYDFFAKTYLPIARRLGARAEAELLRPGYYPAGGGSVRLTVEPAQTDLTGLDLLDRGEIRARKATATVAHLPRDIAEREISTLQEALGWGPSCCEIVAHNDSPGPGNVVSVEVETESIHEIFTAFGERGVRAEVVAERAAAETRDYLARCVPVGRHLADQLVLLLAIAGGGSFRTLTPTMHTLTQLEIVPLFLDVSCHAMQERDGVFRIEVVKSAKA